MKTTSDKIVRAIMTEAADTADMCTDQCWSLCHEYIEDMASTHGSRAELKKAVKQFANWLVRKMDSYDPSKANGESDV